MKPSRKHVGNSLWFVNAKNKQGPQLRALKYHIVNALLAS
ncbi:hypothetical protein VAE151_560509 [Vibrio aestuarianus]|uniref:Uncharacterized protein n=1 Tax=Vibrio aestuarianus TaxID=28171 RepID=A0ABM9FS77_9VIBR|nr:hypothetical protein VAEU17_190078 [Vibrio aestuarianus]CAH8201971.1 hypothetical protein VAE308_1051154 [Vibrio aestuarianus]CAH8206625.1 hypothetical protein VAE055_380506 [Vibrio aestuarianus]CAH8206631.1 hypothetical protein VAE032_271149 [Vibrio aestuarianus]CAH8206794.1 hypothetical protein VAE128_461155 [Vibrio aestuarianus]